MPSQEMDEGLVPDETLLETGELDEKQTRKKRPSGRGRFVSGPRTWSTISKMATWS